MDQREESAVLLYQMLGSPAIAVDSASAPNRKIMSADRSAGIPGPVDSAGEDTMNERPGELPRPANIADPFWDLLLPLDEARRLGFIRRLAIGFYENWRPTREEVAYLVDFELGRLSAEQLNVAVTVPVAPERFDDRSFGSAVRDELAQQPGELRAVRSTPTESTVTRQQPRSATLATFKVDCGLLAPPFRFIAAGLSSAGWTVRLGERYRRAYLHYRLVSSLGPSAAGPGSVAPVAFNADITCVPDVAAPFVPTDGRSQKHSVGRGMVLGRRGPWPLADGVTAISFLLTAQSPPGIHQRQVPTGSLRIDLRSGTATWRTSAGFEDASDKQAATR
jgi:hypothetical protein